MRRALKIYEAYLNQENIEMGAPIARTKWKLAQTLREIGGDTTEEVEKFEQEATTFLFASRAFLGSQNSGLCEVDFDNLVFYWSK
jgi:hypothetical protein